MRDSFKFVFVLLLLALFAAALPEDTQKNVNLSSPPPDSLSVEVKIARRLAEKMPEEVDSVFDSRVHKLYCWSMISGARDTLTIAHVWNHEGKEIARAPIKVTSVSFRAYSSQVLPEQRIGRWTVYVVDGDGNVLGLARFRIAGE